MPESHHILDWSLVQVFLAVAETGSLSAAARALGVSQPTLGRQVAAMEDRLGMVLFERRSRGMAPTPAAAAMVEPAREMRAAAARLGLLAASASEGVAGTVRITASHFVSLNVLPPILARLRRAEPEIAIELAPSDESENLLFHEADIAIRMYRPVQGDLVTRHLGEIRLGLYGARSYLDRVGRPSGPDDLARFDFVGYDRNPVLIEGFRAAGWPVDRDFFATRCDSDTVGWELVRAGCGLGFCQRQVAEADPAVEEVAFAGPIPTLPIWLTAHEALRRTPRIRRVWDGLAAGLARVLS